MHERFQRSDFSGPDEALYPTAQLEDRADDSDLSDRLVRNVYVFTVKCYQKAIAVTPLAHLGSLKMIWRRVEKKACQMMTNCLILI